MGCPRSVWLYQAMLGPAGPHGVRAPANLNRRAFVVTEAGQALLLASGRRCHVPHSRRTLWIGVVVVALVALVVVAAVYGGGGGGGY